ncbi:MULTISPECIES: hypothetical protein [Thermus]|nr:MULTISPECIES: hypothetical protein [Thermus]
MPWPTSPSSSSPREPSSLLLLLLSLVLLLGAVFVYLVLRLVDAIVASL